MGFSQMMTEGGLRTQPFPKLRASFLPLLVFILMQSWLWQVFFGFPFFLSGFLDWNWMRKWRTGEVGEYWAFTPHFPDKSFLFSVQGVREGKEEKRQKSFEPGRKSGWTGRQTRKGVNSQMKIPRNQPIIIISTHWIMESRNRRRREPASTRRDPNGPNPLHK